MKKINKDKVLNFLLLIASLLVFFLIFEVSIRVFYPQSILIERFDSKLGISLKPNINTIQYNQQLKRLFSYHVVTNSQGLREYDNINLDKDGKVRIEVFGDSFVFGRGVDQDDTFISLLSKETANLNFEVINFGVSGTSIDYYYLNLMKNGLKFDPDIVVFGVYAGNDFSSLEAFSTIKDGLLTLNNQGVLEYKKPENDMFAFFMASHFQSSRFLILLLDSNPFTRKIVEFFRISHGGKRPLFALSHNEYLDYRAKNFEILKKVKKLSEDKDFKFLVILFPSKEQVYDEAYKNYTLSSGTDEVLERYEIQDDLGKFMKEYNISYVDLTASFIDKSDESELYYPIDPHWTADGNILTAMEVKKALISLLEGNSI